MTLLRQSIYSRLAGYEDVNDAEWLSVHPAMRHVVGGRAALTDKHAASTSEVGRFETDQRKPPKRLILDMDSSVSETHGQQEGSAVTAGQAAT